MSTSTMAQVLPVLHILGELFIAFFGSSVMVLALLRLASVQFPTDVTLRITFVSTLVVFAALRAAGWIWGLASPSAEAGSTYADGKATWLAAQRSTEGGLSALPIGCTVKTGDGELCRMV